MRIDRDQVENNETSRVYTDRAPGGHCHHQCFDRAFAAGGAIGTRSGPADPMYEQSEANRSGVHNYEGIAGAFPPSNIAGFVNGTTTFTYNGFSVHARILPFMEQGVAFNSINFVFTHRTVQNSTVVGLALTCFLCPSDPNMDGLTAFPSGVNARVPCYGFNEGDWFIWNALSSSGFNNPPITAASSGPT